MFLVINTVMIGLLIKETTDAYNIPNDQKILYEVGSLFLLLNYPFFKSLESL